MQTKSLLRALVSLGLLFIVLLAAPQASAAPPTRVAIIVPGQGEGPDSYSALAAVLQVQGYQTRILNLPGVDLVADANAISTDVDRVRAQQPGSSMSLVGHSVGGLSARYYLKVMGGNRYVRNYVAIGTPQYGVALQCAGQTHRDYCSRSAFLEVLNSGIDTPGHTMYYSIRSEREYSDGRLDGGQCRLPAIPGVPGMDGRFDHGSQPYNPLVWSAVSTALSGGCPGAYVVDPDHFLAPENTVRASFPN